MTSASAASLMVVPSIVGLSTYSASTSESAGPVDVAAAAGASWAAVVDVETMDGFGEFDSNEFDSTEFDSTEFVSVEVVSVEALFVEPVSSMVG